MKFFGIILMGTEFVDTGDGYTSEQILGPFAAQVERDYRTIMESIGVTTKSAAINTCYIYHNPDGPGFAESAPELVCSVEYRSKIASFPQDTRLVTQAKSLLDHIWSSASQQGYSARSTYTDTSSPCRAPEFTGDDTYYDGKSYTTLPCIKMTKGVDTRRETMPPKCFFNISRDLNSQNSSGPIDYYLQLRCSVRAKSYVEAFSRHESDLIMLP